MEYFNSTKWKLYASLEAGTREQVARKVYERTSERDLVNMLNRHDCPREIAELAATHPKHTLRRAAALNSNISAETLDELTRDTSRTVAETALAVQLIAASREPENNEPVKRTPALSKAIMSVITNKTIPEHRLTRLLAWLARDPEWLADKKLMEAAWESDVPMFEALVPSVGLGGALAATLTGVRSAAKWLAVECALELAETPQEAYAVLRANSEQLKTLLSTHRLFASPRDKPGVKRNKKAPTVDLARLGDAPEEVQCVYLAMDNCPEETLKEAVLSEYDVTGVASTIAALNGARNPEFRKWLLEEIVKIWEYDGYGHWEVAQALENEDLLDLPITMLEDHDYEETGTIARAIEVFRAQVEATLNERPEAWETYAALERNFEGTLREMVAAIRGL